MPEIEYHVQEFDQGWYSILITNDLDEAKAEIAKQQSDEAKAEQFRLMVANLTPIDEPDHLRIALRKTLEGLYVHTRVPAYNKNAAGPTSLAHIDWMLTQIDRNLANWPTDKTSRWIGYAQGVLAANGRLDVDVERDRTRPIFHEAYQALGLIIPETVDR